MDKWKDILPQIEQWLNKTVASSTGYAPVELIFNVQKLDIFAKFLTEIGDSTEHEELATKVLKDYAKMKENASKMDRRRKLGNSRWTPNTTHVGCHKRNNIEIYVILRGGHFSFRRYVYIPIQLMK